MNTLPTKKQWRRVLGSLLLAGCIAYLAWCWRSFYLHPTTADPRIPQTARAAVVNWLESTGQSPRSRFTLEEGLRLLVEPSSPWPWVHLSVQEITEGRVKSIRVEYEPSRVYCDLFSEIDGEWVAVAFIPSPDRSAE
jgi:hypothetical protein